MHEKVAIGTSTSLDDDEAIHKTSVSFGVAMPAKQHKNNSNGYNRALSKTSKMYDMDGDGQLGKLMMVVSRILRVELLRWAPPQPSDLSRLFMYYKIGICTREVSHQHTTLALLLYCRRGRVGYA